MKNKIYKFLTIFFVVVTFTNCSEEELDPLNTKNFELNTFMEGYHAKNFPQESAEKQGNPSVYIDLSSGLKYAFDVSENKNADIMKTLAGVLKEGHNWYEVNNEVITEIDGERYDLYNKVTSSESFGGIYAPLGDALDSVVNQSNDVLFITDYEEYTKTGDKWGAEELTPYLIKPIQSWLENGNSVDFLFDERFTEINKGDTVEKTLYFTVFSFGKEKTMLTAIKKALDTRGIDFKGFSLDLSTFGAQVKGDTSLVPWSNGAGGLFSTQNSKLKAGFEYVSLQPWEVLKEKDYIAKLESPLFFDNLNMDATTSQIYDITSYEVKTYDVTDDYVNYCISTLAQEESISIVKNDKGEDVWDASTSGNKLISAAYVENTNTLKEGFTNIPNEGLNRIEDVFSIDDIYTDRLENTPNDVVLRTNLSGPAEQLPKMVRVDICIGNILEKSKVFERIDQDFTWYSKLSGKDQECVSESLKNIINEPTIEAKVKGQVLYSYYIAENPYFFLSE